MTIQPGLRIEASAQDRATTTGRTRVVARGKFAPPRFPADLVGTKRWQATLAALADHEICLVRAPAGYGKTAFAATLFAAARAAGWFAGWVSFERDDNEPAAIGHLFEAVRLASGGLRSAGSRDISAASVPAAILSAALADLIDDADRPLLLVLDDIDRLSDARVIDVLNGLLRHPPAQLRLVLTSRAVPATDTGDVERRGMALAMDGADVGLTDDEVRSFLRATGKALSPQEAAAINAVLQGWPAGLRLTARHGGAALPQQIDLHLAPVIGSLTDAERRFAQRCAAVPHLCGDLARLLGGEENGAAMLRDFAARGLFVEPLAGRGGWYRIHSAFRTALARYPGAPEADTRVELHRAAARYFATQGMEEPAAEQAMLAGDTGRAAALLARIAMPMLRQGDLSALSGWIDRLPPAEVAAVPALREARAWLYALTAHPAAQAAIAALEAKDVVPEARAIGLVHRAYAGDGLAEIVETCDQLLAAPHGLSDFAVAMIRTLLAHGALKRGLFGLVHDVLRPLTPHNADCSLDLPLALAICAKASLSRAQGQLDDAERLLFDARQLTAGVGLAPALVDAALARCHYERDDMAAAAGLAANALPALEGSAFQDATIPAFLVAIRAAVHLEQARTAASLIDRAEALAFARDWIPMKAMCVVERARLRLPPTIDAESIVAMGDEEAAVLDPLSAPARAFAILSEMRAYEAIASGDRPRLTAAAERLLRLASNADDAELRATATLLNILPQLSGRCDKMVELEIVRFLNHAASAGFRRTIVDILDVTGVRAVQNFCSEAYSSGSFLALLKLAEPSRRNPALEGARPAAPGEAFSFLTEREIEILSALNAGESNKEIARTLQLAPETVKWHLKNVMRKLRANSREEAVQNASTLGLKLIELPGRH
ncbi:LuxR C-terminal-related transcriptional regulator [Sphingopyxis sp. JAI128]|uniref:helix-turn-helix transcriptional regulator n=1 Tax=Sphingopyxis sp. JAI128 TaxID=2723066 RepID=UPI0016130B84|nr:LuxR C-terminal-related transcriptional regulator [Sphingopyxis sp. JAI128]MBB6424520.1 LuxR family maltose regulon positive regulatory protein [Sphingopyxis sp. JAI128]